MANEAATEYFRRFTAPSRTLCRLATGVSEGAEVRADRSSFMVIEVERVAAMVALLGVVGSRWRII